MQPEPFGIAIRKTDRALKHAIADAVDDMKDDGDFKAIEARWFAREVARRVVFLDQGRLVGEGPSSVIFDTPAQERTREFLKKVLRRGYDASK
jgi:ABC-type polar amino acid transport system ATPase subunit